MNSLTDRPDLERFAATALADLVAAVPVGGVLPTTPYPELFVVLEYLIPVVLRRNHPEWQAESIDHFSAAVAVRTSERAVELAGTCILITDQTATPFAIALSLQEGGALHALRVRLGEPGSGPLGISGPPCASGDAAELLLGLPERLDGISWIYDVAL